MSRRRLFAAAGLLACVAANSAIAESRPQPAFLFPIVIDAPQSISTRSVASGQAAFVQPFRSSAAVRVSTAYSVDQNLGPAAKLTEGAILFSAVRDGEEIFCAPATSGAKDILLNGHFGVCFRDTNHDGVFEGQISTPTMLRAETAYDLGARGWSDWTPANLGYSPLAAADIPTGEIRVGYVYRKPKIGFSGAWAELRVCVPATLAKKDDAADASYCGALLEPGVENHHRTRVWLEPKKPEALPLSFGPIKTTMKITPDGLLDTDVTDTFKPGPALLVLAATYGPVMDPKAQLRIFAVLPKGSGESSPGVVSAISSEPSSQAPAPSTPEAKP